MEKSETTQTSTLGYALLGLIKMNPSTGYQLRKIFQETPMARYSSSPGAIYPALRVLASRTLIHAEPGVGKTGKAIETWRCTARGSRQLKSWLRRSVTTDDVYRNLDVVLLRFSYLDVLDDLDWSIDFLNQFRQAALECRARVQQIRKALKRGQPTHGQYALRNGEAVFAAHARWAERTTASIKRLRARRIAR